MDRSDTCRACGLGQTSCCPEFRGEKCADKLLPAQCLGCRKVQSCVRDGLIKRGKCRRREAC